MGKGELITPKYHNRGCQHIPICIHTEKGFVEMTDWGVVAFQCKHNGLHAREGETAEGQKEWPPVSVTSGVDAIAGSTGKGGEKGEQ